MTLKLEKCEFAKPSLIFDGHVIGSGMHGPDPNKVSCVESMKPPVTKNEVRQVLGFFGFFRLYLIEQEQRAIYLLEMTRCLTGIFGRGLPWDIQNRTS